MMRCMFGPVQYGDARQGKMYDVLLVILALRHYSCALCLVDCGGCYCMLSRLGHMFHGSDFTKMSLRRLSATGSCDPDIHR